MKKVLFFIPNLSVGGAEKVLVNLVNNMDKNKFDITVQTLFAGGVNEQFLHEDIKLKHCFKKTFKGNSKILTLFKPKTLYKRFIKEHYDIIVSYLEGPTARIVSGCTDKDTKLVCWIHIQQENKETFSASFKNYDEAVRCYGAFNRIIAVSEYVKQDFLSLSNYQGKSDVLYNTNETEEILRLSNEPLITQLDNIFFNICVVGKLKKNKGIERLMNINKRLNESHYNVHFYFLGTGPMEEYMKDFAQKNDLDSQLTLLGYQTNPYKYVRNCDLFVCGSYAEGFSTAATESLIVGTPVCTVEVSGMKEMLGEHNEYGVVTENSEEALYEGIKMFLDNPDLLAHYKKQAEIRGKEFSTEKTVKAVEDMLISL